MRIQYHTAKRPALSGESMFLRIKVGGKDKLKQDVRFQSRPLSKSFLTDQSTGGPLTVPGDETTLIIRAPREPPISVKAVPISSRSVNVTWQRPIRKDISSSVDGFYVGIKLKGSLEPYTFKSVVLVDELMQHF
ncbi:down syndrome cell adhesion molecule [Caerostris extrusa]|uniref:Down syndrome cell adhesion molecule n=1 Tax=Caerostris extrusa TaxID=172846 RepID=A0AAV4WXC3_CAEEX|nr:down syndrome cell adhesion molecule [Caerostris extrusa]